ncbi:MAG TPA: hypothetical protein VND23_02940 [Acidimicrobiales bacterium]|nr:hypothetical protein [Acidimicrobiales bacterium]
MVGAPRPEGDSPGLLVGLFLHSAYFADEVERYRRLAAAGRTVIVGFAGALGRLPEGVEGVSFAPGDPRGRD